MAWAGARRLTGRDASLERNRTQEAARLACLRHREDVKDLVIQRVGDLDRERVGAGGKRARGKDVGRGQAHAKLAAVQPCLCSLVNLA